MTLEKKLCGLANRNFKRDLARRLKKCGEEFSELAEAIVNGDRDSILEESADVSFILMDICQLAGGSLTKAQRAKWKILMERKKNGVLHKSDRLRKGL
jgi:phosphoribosyl-ATP pyrophosphohydrolase